MQKNAFENGLFQPDSKAFFSVFVVRQLLPFRLIGRQTGN